MAQLILSLLASFDAHLDGLPVTHFRSDKARALLAYLVVEADRPHTRAKLAGLLWPDYPESAALTYLRHALSNLRKILADKERKPPLIRVKKESIQFAFAEGCTSDFTQLSHALTTLAKQGVTTLTEQTMFALQAALATYHAPFLDGFAVADSDRFEEWLLLTRERLHRQVIGALETLANYHLAHHDAAQAILTLQRYLEIEPTSEEIHRRLMALLASDGRRSAALAQFER